MKRNVLDSNRTLVRAGVGLALAPNPNPGVVPNHGPKYGRLSAEWWQWAFSFPAADVPFLNTGGSVDISAHQSGHVWFLAGANNGLTEPRTGEVPEGTSLFLPLVNLINAIRARPSSNSSLLRARHWKLSPGTGNEF